MSTKTTFKRVALVAVAALGAGVLSVAPASAVAGVAVATSVPTVGTAATAINLTESATTTVGFTTAAAALGADDQVYTNTTVRLVVPTGSAVTLADRNGSASGTTAAFSTTGATSNLVAAVNATTGAVTGDASSDVAAGAVVAGTIEITPDVAGTYSVIVTSGAGTTATATINAANLYGEIADGLSNGTQANRSINAVAGVANSVTLTLRTTASASRLITVTGSTIVSAAAPTGGSSTIAADKLSMVVTDDSTAEDITFVVATPAVGTVTVNAFSSSQTGIYSTTAYGTVTITVNASATNGAVLTTSTATMTAVSSAAYLSTDALSLTAPRTANTTVGSIAVDLKVATGQSLAATTATTIAITGPGLLVVSGGNTNATGRSVTETGSDGTFDIAVNGDGTSGVATITITSGAFTATRTVTFYGTVASYALTTKNAYLAVGVTDTQILTVLAKDSAGINIPSATVFVSSSSTATATVTSSSVVTNADGATGADIGARGVAAGTATITVGNTSGAAPTVSATFTLNIVKAGIASVVLSFDKAEYTAGEKAVITVTAKNADAALVGDATYANMFTSAGITSSANLTGLTAAASVATTSGVKTYTVFMPLSAGPVSISATLDTSVAAAIQETVVTASATVLSDGVAQAAVDAAAEATDAANAATDAANAAAEAADAATAAAQDAADAVAALATSVEAMVNALKRQITSLTNLVIKIQKKVRA